MRSRSVLWPVVVVGAAVLLSGCVGEPKTFAATKPAPILKPIVLTPRTVARRSARAVAPAMSRAEKERLFQGFQRSQALKAPTPAVEEKGLP